MMRRWLVLVAVAYLLIAASPAATASPVSLESLVADGEAYNGQEILVVGELVGDFGFRSDGTMWVQLNSDSYVEDPVVEGGPLRGANVGIGIRMPSELAEGLDAPGGYRRRGPVVAVTGTWRWHDEDLSGESYLDVTSLEVVDEARSLSEHPDPTTYLIGGVLLLVAVGLWRAYVRRKETY